MAQVRIFMRHNDLTTSTSEVTSNAGRGEYYRDWFGCQGLSFGDVTAMVNTAESTYCPNGG